MGVSMRAWTWTFFVRRLLEVTTLIATAALGADLPRLQLEGMHGRPSWGHRGAVQALAFTADGASLWSSGLDGTIAVWPLNSRDGPVILKTATTVFGLCAAAKGRLLVSGGDGSQGADDITLWNPATHARWRGFRSPGRGVNAVDLSADGRELLTGGDDSTVMVWSLPDAAAAPRVLNGHSARVVAVRLSADGRRALSASGDRTIRLWDLASGQSKELRGHTRGATGVEFLSDGHRAVSVGMDGALIVWNLDTSEPAPALTGHDGGIKATARVPGRDWVVTGGIDGTVRVWDLAAMTEVHTFKGHRDAVNAVAVSPDGGTIASGSEDGAIRLWALQSGKEIVPGSGHAGSVRFVVSVPDAPALVTGDDEGELIIWPLTSADPALRWRAGFVPQAGTVMAGRRLMIAGEGARFETWSLPPGKEPVAFGGPFEGEYAAHTFRSQGRHLISALHGPRIEEFDTLQAHSKELHAVVDDQGDVLALAADDERIVVGLLGNKVLVYTPPASAETLEVAGIDPHGGVAALALAGVHLAAGLLDGRIVLLDLSRGVVEREWQAHSDALKGLTFLRGSDILISAGAEGMICAWRSADAEACGQLDLTPFNDQGTVVAALADGERAAVGTARGIVLVLRTA
jgi:WD40 repeat protein